MASSSKQTKNSSKERALADANTWETRVVYLLDKDRRAQWAQELPQTYKGLVRSQFAPFF